MSSRRPCLDCGTPTTNGTRCPACTRGRDRQRGTPAQRGYDSTWRRIRRHVLNRDAHTCRWCGQPANTVDHVVPLAHGGTSEPENLVAACGPCNSARGGATRRTNR